MNNKLSGRPVEWLAPLAFIFCSGWIIWQMPTFILDWGGDGEQLAAQFARMNITPNAPIVLLYEVVLQYLFEKPALWASELSLWLAGFVFLTAGLYAMQQRSHIRIFLLYDMMPRWAQRMFAIISTSLIILFAVALVYEGYGEVFAKFGHWETFGTAFYTPIPATLKMAVLIVVPMVAIQAVINLISDLNTEPAIHTAADDIDQDELDRLRASIGADIAMQSKAGL